MRLVLNRRALCFPQPFLQESACLDSLPQVEASFFGDPCRGSRSRRRPPATLLLQLPRADACAPYLRHGACPLVSCSCFSRSLGFCGRRGIRGSAVSSPMSSLSGPSRTTSESQPRLPLAPDEEEPPTMTTGHNSLMFFVLLFVAFLGEFNNVSKAFSPSLANHVSELCQDAALWRRIRCRHSHPSPF